MQENIAIELSDVNKTFFVNDKRTETLSGWINLMLRPNTLRKKLVVLKDINLIIEQGETLGIIGRNGSGKSTLVKIMSGAYQANKGSVVKKTGRSMLMNLRVGMNRELTTRQNIYINGSALGLRIKEIDKVFDEIVAFAELEEFVDVVTRNFSNGMMARLAFSVAIKAGAEIMFLDEIFAVGDKIFREKAIKVFEKNWLDHRTIIMVSHSMGQIKKYCDRVLYLKKGEIEFLGDPAEAVRLYELDN